MRLIRLHAENFGALQDYRMEFCDTLNVLHKENGWGKSTLAVFVKAMLYGLPATSKRSLDENERKKYTPWQGGAFGGSLEFESDKGRFRVERFFGAKESGDTFALYDLTTNKPSNTYTEALGEELFGIDADGFERTVYLSQRDAQPKGENNSITAKLGNLLDDVDDVGNFDDAMAALDKRRKHYVLTGNRGRIAELETERNEKRAEVERLVRTRDAMEALEAERTALLRQIRTAEEALERVRTDVHRAGRLRERDVLLEQKQQMLSELEQLEEQRKVFERSLGGNHPTDRELSDQRRLSEALRDAKARLDALPAPDALVVTAEILPRETVETLPDDALLTKLTVENTRLQNLCHREESLLTVKKAMTGEGERKFPTQEQLDAAFASVERAKKLHADADALLTSSPKKSGAPIFSLLLGILAILLIAAAFLPMLDAPLDALSIAVGCAVGALAIILFIASVTKNKRHIADINAHAAALRRDAEERLTQVRALLSAHGFPTDRDPIRALTELSLLAHRRRDDLQKATQLDGELKEIKVQIDRSLLFLQTTLRFYGITLPRKNDYRDEIEALRRDVDAIRRAKEEKSARTKARTQAELEWTTLKQQILPFLKRYDPERKMSASECLNTVAAWETEYRRLGQEIKQKTAALNAFLAEKNPDAIAQTAEVLDYDTLIAEEKRLQETLSTQKSRKTELSHRMERLAMDADRIPDLEEQLIALNEEIAEAKANSTTIANTARMLEEAKTALSTRYLDDMQKSFQRFLAVLTEGDVPESVMDASFDVSLRKSGKTRSMESFSRGWRDAVQFCVRLSLADALFKDGERPFLLLDDPFVNLDDSRLSAAKHLVVTLSKNYQIIYMVCHADRK
ncbi:MAG: AAA family ATPase [Clostridia bacterium]|nr:AAA family ATPase [Clostridia bacterium]